MCLKKALAWDKTPVILHRWLSGTPLNGLGMQVSYRRAVGGVGGAVED
jgi:hypothetical protein